MTFAGFYLLNNTKDPEGWEQVNFISLVVDGETIITLMAGISELMHHKIKDHSRPFLRIISGGGRSVLGLRQIS